MPFAARGCPVGCSFCVVPQLEGTTFTLDWEFQPAPILGDNNLSALSSAFQEHIIARYQATGCQRADANRGFEPRPFDEGTYQRRQPILRGPWSFAYDEAREGAAGARVCRILAGEVPKRKRVYVLLGNEPLESCWDRVLSVLAWGGEPFCQYVLPLNWLGDPAMLRPRFAWSYGLGRGLCRYVNTFGWRTFPPSAYQPRHGSPPPLAGTALASPAWDARWATALADNRTFHHRLPAPPATHGATQPRLFS